MELWVSTDGSISDSTTGRHWSQENLSAERLSRHSVTRMTGIFVYSTYSCRIIRVGPNLRLFVDFVFNCTAARCSTARDSSEDTRIKVKFISWSDALDWLLFLFSKLKFIVGQERRLLSVETGLNVSENTTDESGVKQEQNEPARSLETNLPVLCF